jgi:hypothetical protein
MKKAVLAELGQTIAKKHVNVELGKNTIASH